MVDIIIGLLTSGIVQLLKLIKLPTKWAPVAVFVVSLVIVAIAKALGFTPDINSIYSAIATALGIGGATALGYDFLKGLFVTTEVKK